MVRAYAGDPERRVSVRGLAGADSTIIVRLLETGFGNACKGMCGGGS